ncbi:MAG: MgtC/SapB family protein [Rubrivivax sp.]|nr:MgtC/SapB family protein [Rubrivivax sp.]
MPGADAAAVAALAVAAGAGLLVGLERERRKGRGPQRGPAGLRTFVLVSVAGALAGLSREPLVIAALLAGVSLLAALAYWRSSARDPGLTTELALLVMALNGVLAARQPALAAGIGAGLALLLASRAHLHRMATRALSEAEWHDALLLAALALVLLPLMPADPQPWLAGLSWRHVLSLVVLILAVQALAHVATRLFGAAFGLGVAGFFGGFVSSTATIAAMASQARAHPAHLGACRGAAVLSTAATWVFALLLLGAVSPTAAARFLPCAVAGAAVAGFIGVWLSSLAQREASASRSRLVPAPPQGGPLRLREAMIVAALLLGVNLLVSWLQQRHGLAGAWAASSLAALVDAHAGVAALGALHAAGRLAVDELLLALVTAVAANSLTRTVVAATAGGARFGWTVGAALAASTSAAALVAFFER